MEYCRKVWLWAIELAGSSLRVNLFGFRSLTVQKSLFVKVVTNKFSMICFLVLFFFPCVGLKCSVTSHLIWFNTSTLLVCVVLFIWRSWSQKTINIISAISYWFSKCIATINNFFVYLFFLSCGVELGDMRTKIRFVKWNVHFCLHTWLCFTPFSSFWGGYVYVALQHNSSLLAGADLCNFEIWSCMVLQGLQSSKECSGFVFCFFFRQAISFYLREECLLFTISIFSDVSWVVWRSILIWNASNIMDMFGKFSMHSS